MNISWFGSSWIVCLLIVVFWIPLEGSVAINSPEIDVVECNAWGGITFLTCDLNDPVNWICWWMSHLLPYHVSITHATAFLQLISSTGGIQFKVLTTLPMTISYFLLEFKDFRTKIENLKQHIGRNIQHVTFRRFVTSLVQKLMLLEVYKNCKSSHYKSVCT